MNAPVVLNTLCLSPGPEGHRCQRAADHCEPKAYQEPDEQHRTIHPDGTSIVQWIDSNGPLIRIPVIRDPREPQPQGAEACKP